MSAEVIQFTRFPDHVVMVEACAEPEPPSAWVLSVSAELTCGGQQREREISLLFNARGDPEVTGLSVMYITSLS